MLLISKNKHFARLSVGKFDTIFLDTYYTATQNVAGSGAGTIGMSRI